MATHSSVLAWRIPRTEKPGGPWSTGSQRAVQDWSDLARTQRQLTTKPVFSAGMLPTED